MLDGAHSYLRHEHPDPRTHDPHPHNPANDQPVDHKPRSVVGIINPPPSAIRDTAQPPPAYKHTHAVQHTNQRETEMERRVDQDHTRNRRRKRTNRKPAHSIPNKSAVNDNPISVAFLTNSHQPLMHGTALRTKQSLFEP